MTARRPARITRRAALAGTAAMAAAPAPTPAPSIAPSLAPSIAPSGLRAIDHFIILMKENRSFDHYFGTLAGVRGFADPDALEGVFAQPDPYGEGARLLPFRLDTINTSAQGLSDLDHSRAAQHGAYAGGRMDGWIASLARRHREAARFTMGHLTRADLPYYCALADAFTLCDGYHASVLGPTHPNRIVLMTGGVDAAGRFGRPALDNRGRAYAFETYPERLTRAGITWRVHHDADDYGCNVLRYFTQYQRAERGSVLHDSAMRDRGFESLLDDLRRGNIPQVTWVVPPGNVSEHPPNLPAAGEHHTARVLAALWSNPALWARTAVIINWDENDGWFDHVPPPRPEPGTADEWVQGRQVGLGFRVPCLVISPWSRGGFVCGQTLDHSSTLRLLEARFGVEAAGISVWRRDAVGDMTAAFDFAAPDFAPPALPETSGRLAVVQQAVATLPAPVVVQETGLPQVETGTRRRRG